jgi:hypothetical protein
LVRFCLEGSISDDLRLAESDVVLARDETDPDDLQTQGIMPELRQVKEIARMLHQYLWLKNAQG